MYRHFLTHGTQTIEITEPIGFDASSFKIEQKSDGFARDITIMGEDVDLEFRAGVYGEPSQQITQLANGVDVPYLTSGFEWLLNIYENEGFEANVLYTLTNNGSTFQVGQLMFTGAETDKQIYFRCKVIQNLERAKYKRNVKVKTNAFGNSDINGNSITPTQTDKVLLKAKPLFGVSRWEKGVNTVTILPEGDTTSSFGLISNVVRSDLRKTLSFIPGKSGIQDFVYIEGADDLVNGTLKIGVNCQFVAVGASVTVRLFWGVKDSVSYNLNDYNLLVSQSGTNFTINQQFTLNNLTIGRGQSLYLFFNVVMSFPNLLAVNVLSTDNFVDFSATSIGIDSVISGVRLIDLLKSKANHIGNLPLFAPDFDVDGKYYNQHVSNGKMIRQIETEFTNTMDEVYSSVCDELNYDWKVGQNSIEIKHYRDFYRDKEIGMFEIAPNSGYKENFNERYLVNTFEYKYAKYEQDKDEKGTIDAVHTESQWKLANNMVENNLQREVKHIRDPFLFERVRRNNTSTNGTTSLSNDDDLFMYETLPLAPNSQGGFSARVTYQTNGNELKVSNRTPEDTEFFFRWDLLGFTVGASFQIVSGNNIGNYTVVAVEATVLTLQGNPATITYNGQSLSKFSYTLNDVQFVARTNEGLVFVEGVENGDRFLNLKYTIKRNLQEFSEYLSTCLLYSQKLLRNQFYKVNSNLVSRFQDESVNVVEVANFEPNNAIITPVIATYEVVANFDDVYNLLLNGDGYLRVLDNVGKVVRGYPKMIDFSWSTNVMKLELELKNDSQIIEVTNLDWFSYQINGNFVMLFDDKSRLLLNPTDFKKLSIHGITFENIINFVETLENV